jgi:inner membrane protein
MAAARASGRGRLTGWALFMSMLLWSCLSMLPDADVIGFVFGVGYGDEWGHRGATHSFAFALGVALVVGLTASIFHLSALRTALIAAVVVGSHAVLDTLTDGGLGCALLWPFTRARYFAPWNPIPVAPIGLRFFSKVGLSVALTELSLFAPVFLFALWPRRIRGRK